MGLIVMPEQMRAARKVGLYDWIVRHQDPSTYVLEGDSIRPCCRPTVSVKKGFTGYKDFETGETGNSVDYVLKYVLGCWSDRELPRAVMLLLDEEAAAAPSGGGAAGSGPFQLPRRVEPPYKVFDNYLIGALGVPEPVVRKLVDELVMYEKLEDSQMVFVNKDRNYAEIHRPDLSSPSYQVLSGSDPASYWSFTTNNAGPLKAYICESALDALLLFARNWTEAENARNSQELGKWAKLDEYGAPALYASVGSPAARRRIDAIIDEMRSRNVYLAFSKEEDRQRVIEMYPDRRNVIPLAPEHGSWMDDYMACKVKPDIPRS